MTSTLSGLVRRSLLNYASSSSSSVAASRLFSTTSPALARRSKSKLEEDISLSEIDSLLDEDPDSPKDSPTSAHLLLQEKRIVRHYLRLIEVEMPNLVGTLLDVLG
jgi:small subunit ribosomal protein S35